MSDLSKYVGEKLREAADNLTSEKDHIQHQLNALFSAWEKWDVDELSRMGYITESEANSLKKEMEKEAEHEFVLDSVTGLCAACGGDCKQ